MCGKNFDLDYVRNNLNRVTMHGRLADDAKSFLVNTGEKEMTMISFSLPP